MAVPPSRAALLTHTRLPVCAPQVASTRAYLNVYKHVASELAGGGRIWRHTMHDAATCGRLCNENNECQVTVSTNLPPSTPSPPP